MQFVRWSICFEIPCYNDVGILEEEKQSGINMVARFILMRLAGVRHA